jgi:hypothetical protein
MVTSEGLAVCSCSRKEASFVSAVQFLGPLMAAITPLGSLYGSAHPDQGFVPNWRHVDLFVSFLLVQTISLVTIHHIVETNSH